MVQEALPLPQDSSCEQTIVATAVKLGGELFPERLSLVEFDDVHRFRSRKMYDEGYCSRHYVHWMRHMLYRDALRLRLRPLPPYSKGGAESCEPRRACRSKFVSRRAE